MDIAKIKNYINTYTTTKYTPQIRKRSIKIIRPRTEAMYTMDFSMAFVSKNFQQVTQFVSCRDYLHDQIRTSLNNKRHSTDTHPYYPEHNDPIIHMHDLRLLVKFNKLLIKQFCLGLKALNNIETFAGINKTKVFNAEYASGNNNDNVLLLICANGLYMTNPHLLSMLTLILRFFTLNTDVKYIHTNDLSNQYGNFINSSKKDTHLMKSCYKYMHIICKERDYIFKNMTLKHLFPNCTDRSFHSKGGIEKLCIADTLNEEVNEKIKQLYAIYA